MKEQEKEGMMSSNNLGSISFWSLSFLDTNYKYSEKNKGITVEKMSILKLWHTPQSTLHFVSILRTSDVAEGYYIQDQKNPD